jgi:alkylated DNA repair dioxygenase AlkB
MHSVLHIPDAHVELFEEAGSPLLEGEYVQRLITEVPWRSESITLFGKTFLQPRLLEFFGDDGVFYTYSKKQYNAKPWSPLLAELRDIAGQLSGSSFNCVLANYYRDERDSMGFHSDDEPELGAEPTIVSMSFGATRVFVMKHKTNKDLAPVRIPLSNGSVLIMKGATQQHWVHGIEKKKTHIGPRVNLTFRHIVQQ